MLCVCYDLRQMYISCLLQPIISLTPPKGKRIQNQGVPGLFLRVPETFCLFPWDVATVQLLPGCVYVCCRSACRADSCVIVRKLAKCVIVSRARPYASLCRASCNSCYVRFVLRAFRAYSYTNFVYSIYKTGTVGI